MAAMRWADVRLVPLLAALLAVQGSPDILWTNHRFPNGTTVHKCVGDNVSFPWYYDVRGDGEATLIFWYSEKNGTIATSLLNHQFIPYSDRVTHVHNADIQLSGLTAQDAGTYGVEVLFGSQNRSVQETHLVVVDLPTLVDTNIYVKKQSGQSASTGNDTCDPRVELQCGQFLSRGHPAVSVTWTDPQGKQLPSTGYHDGFFSLALPRDYKGGNYTCSLLLDLEMSRCQSDNRSFGATTASIYVETTETKVKNHAKSIEALKMGVQQALKLQNETEHQVIDDMVDRITSLESTIENVTEDMNQQHLLDQHVSDMKFDHLQDSLHSLENEMEQSLSDKASSLSKELKAVSDAVSKLTAASANQQQATTDLKKQVEDLETRLEKEQRLSSQLEAKVATQTVMLSDQKAELDDKILTLEKENAGQKRANSQLTNDLTELNSRLTTLSETLKKQEASLTGLTDRVNDQQDDLDAREAAREKDRAADVAAQKESNSRVETRLNALQSDLRQQNSSVQSLRGRLDDRLQRQEGKHTDLQLDVDLLKQSFKDAASTTASLVDQLGDLRGALQVTQQNLTAQNAARENERAADVAAQKESNSQVKTRLNALQSDLRQQNSSVRSLQERLEHELQEQEEKHSNLQRDVAFLKESVQGVTSTAASRLDELGEALQDTRQNLTESLRASRVEQTNLLQNSLRTSALNQSRVAQSLQRELTQLGNSVQLVAASVNSSRSRQLTELRQTVAENRNQYSSLQTRVQSVEQRVGTAMSKIMPIRLVGGRSSREGRVEILVGNSWGTVCDDSWGSEDAKVVCNMLGFFRGGEPRSEAAFGQGTGHILLDDVECTGYELDIRACKARGINHNCGHGEDAGVVCA